jgi:RNA polymerase sigma-70 factor (ECF subfamily)
MPPETMSLPLPPCVEPVESAPAHIARGLRARDVALLGRLAERYQTQLVRYLIYLIGRREHVEDLVQETWLRVLERGRQYDGRMRFEPWLFAIARHLALDLMRRRRVLSLDGARQDGAAGDDGSFPAGLPAGGPSPFEAAARSEDAARLAASLAALGPIYREALLLRFQEEMSLLEIAGVVGAPVSTVASRIQRGLAALRARLAREGDADGRS